MTQPRRQDEIDLFARLREQSKANGGVTPGLTNVAKISQEIGIPERRTIYLLLKWVEKGWWDYGLTPYGGWFTAEAPAELKP